MIKFENVIRNDASFFLNLIRVISVEMVLVGHIFWWSHKKDSLISIASFGVVLFFILSGILISNSLFSKNRDGNYSFGEYFMDRFARIYSGLAPCLLVVLLLDGVHLWLASTHYLKMENAVFSDQYSFRNFLGSLAMIQNIGVFPAPLRSLNIGYGFGTARPLWSLAIEWWLYLAFGWAVLKWQMIKMAKVRYFFVLALFSIIPGCYLIFRGEFGGLILVWFLGVGITVLLNLLRGAGVRRSTPFLYFGLFLVILSMVRFLAYFQEPYSLVTSILTLGGIFLIVHALSETRSVKAAGIVKSVDYIAAYSYTLYLIHMPIILLLALYLKNNFLSYLVVSVVLSNGISALIARWTEMKHKALSVWLKSKLAQARTR